MVEFKKIITNLRDNISEINSLVDFQKLENEIKELESKSQSPDIWKDRKIGSQLMTSLASKKSFLDKINSLNSSIESYYQLLQDSSDEDLKILEKDSIEEIKNIKDEIMKIEKDLQFSGEHDEYDVLMTSFCAPTEIESKVAHYERNHKYLREIQECISISDEPSAVVPIVPTGDAHGHGHSHAGRPNAGQDACGAGVERHDGAEAEPRRLLRLWLAGP